MVAAKGIMIASRRKPMRRSFPLEWKTSNPYPASEQKMRASTVVPVALTVECHIAAATSWEPTSLAKFCNRCTPGSSREFRTSWLVLVAETTMKKSGNNDKMALTLRKAYPGILRSVRVLITTVTNLHLNRGQDCHHYEDRVRDRGTVPEVRVLLERQLEEVVRHRHGAVGGATVRQVPRLVEELDRSVGGHDGREQDYRLELWGGDVQQGFDRAGAIDLRSLEGGVVDILHGGQIEHHVVAGPTPQ